MKNKTILRFKPLALKVIGISFIAGTLLTQSAIAGTYTYTTQADWQGGLNTNTNSNEPPIGHVKLNDNIVTPFNHIWVAASGRGTVIRIDTDTGVVQGEYYTAPTGLQRNPSRTTVDANGDVWVGNRNEGGSSLGGSVAKISASATGASTSTGTWNGSTFDARAWNNPGGVDTNGGTDGATDDAILHYVRTPGSHNIRALAVDANNDVWVAGNRNFNNSVNHPHVKIDGSTGVLTGDAYTPAASGGGYGMVIDGNGVIWSASLQDNAGNSLLVKHDPTTGITTNIDTGKRYSYGLAVDNNGKIWMSNWADNTVQRINPTTNVVEGTFAAGANSLRGVAVTADNDIWVAASGSGGVRRLNNDGTLSAFIATGATPTGVSVDSNGKVWVTNQGSSTISRIDPATNLVDLTVNLGAGAAPYNYSDMTGTVLFGTTIATGIWRDVIDSGTTATTWTDILFNTEAEGDIPSTTDLLMEARVSDDGISWSSYLTYGSGDLLGVMGRYLDVRATFSRDVGSNATAILSDLTVNSSMISTPEPLSLWMLGLGLALFAVRRRLVVPSS